MGFFDDDFGFGIDDFFKKIGGEEDFLEYSVAGPDGVKRTFKNFSHNSKRIPANRIITQKKIFFVFDFSGEKSVSVKIKDELIANDYGEKVSTGEKVLEIRSLNKKLGEYVLPKKINFKTLEYTFKGGILEVSFRK